MKSYTVQELEDLWITFISTSKKEIEMEDFFYYLYELENRSSDQDYIIPGES